MSVMCIAAIVASSGCTWFDKQKPGWSDGKGPPPTARGNGLEERPAKDFVAYLNRQASYVNTVRYDDVNVKATVPGQAFVPTLRSGMMVCQKPRGFRMQAGLAFGGDQLDLGSNKDELWLFVKQPKPTFVFCSHSDFPKVQDELPVPFEPDWVLQALGMTYYDPNKPYQIEKDDRTRTYRLISDETTSTGQRIRRITEFAGQTSDGTLPQVKRHLMQHPDRTGNYTTVAIAEVVRVQTMEAGGGQKAFVQVPTQVVLDWPVQKVKMDLTLGKVKLNQTEQPALFAKPSKLGDTSPINLAEMRTPGSAVRYGRNDLP
jgi:hypothetical protein